MKNSIYISMITAMTITALGYGAQQDSSQTNGVTWKRDPFGNVLPQVQGLSTQELGSRLPDFVAGLQEREKGNAFIVQLPHAEAEKVPHLVRSGFTPHNIDDTRTEWVIKNGSPMPEASTATAGARVLVCRDNGDVLVIEDKNMKGRAMFPGGSVDKQELALDAACREIREEVNLTINPGDLQKIALTNRIKGNRYGFSDYCHYYMTRSFSGTPKPQESEVLQLFWCPLTTIAKGEPVNNLRISPTVKLLALHVLSNGNTTSMRVLDPRQYTALPHEKQNQTDIMDVDLFAINTQKNVHAQKN